MITSPNQEVPAQTADIDLSVKRDGRTLAEWQEVDEKTRTDRNFLLASEIAALVQLKELYEIANHPFFDDKTLLVFLFARKLDLYRTAQLLTGHLQWRQAHNMLRPRRVEDCDPKLLAARCTWTHPGIRDREGRGITYHFMGRYKDLSEDAVIQSTVWNFEHLVQDEPLDCHRKGFTIIESIEGMSFKDSLLGTFPSSLQGGRTKKAKKFMKSGIQYFPMRIQSVIVVEPGRILASLLGIAKFFVKAKVLNRIECLTQKQLQDRIGMANLITDFGGTCEFDYEEYLENMRRLEAFGTEEKKQ